MTFGWGAFTGGGGKILPLSEKEGRRAGRGVSHRSTSLAEEERSRAWLGGLAADRAPLASLGRGVRLSVPPRAPRSPSLSSPDSFLGEGSAPLPGSCVSGMF